MLLDVGMVAELTPEDQQNLVGFFKVSVLYCWLLIFQRLQIIHGAFSQHGHMTL